MSGKKGSGDAAEPRNKVDQVERQAQDVTNIMRDNIGKNFDAFWSEGGESDSWEEA